MSAGTDDSLSSGVGVFLPSPASAGGGRGVTSSVDICRFDDEESSFPFFADSTSSSATAAATAEPDDASDRCLLFFVLM